MHSITHTERVLVLHVDRVVAYGTKTTDARDSSTYRFRTSE